MPKLKQPNALRNASMDFLVKFFAKFCNECSIDDESSYDRLSECIVYMKKNVCPYIPWHLSADFHERFLSSIFWLTYWGAPEYPERYTKKALEIIMDEKINGLTCGYIILNYIDPRYVHRIHGLKKLKIPAPKNVVFDLRNFNLMDLTSLTFHTTCVDSDLAVVAKNCPKLEYLDFSYSKHVTDAGLAALDGCFELRDVRFADCKKVTHVAINKFIAAHEKVGKVCAWNYHTDVGFDCFYNSENLKYPTITDFTVATRYVSDQHLLTVVEKFPNLKSLGIQGALSGDLSVLKKLTKLTKLEFRDSFNWDNLKVLLKFIGEKITDLLTRSCITQGDLNFLFKHCSKIENLKFKYQPRVGQEQLDVPSFPELKNLVCSISQEWDRRATVLKFGRMSSLKNLTIYTYYVTREEVEAMILDNTKFPNLKFVDIYRIAIEPNMNDVMQIAKRRNLDFFITVETMT